MRFGRDDQTFCVFNWNTEFGPTLQTLALEGDWWGVCQAALCSLPSPPPVMSTIACLCISFPIPVVAAKRQHVFLIGLVSSCSGHEVLDACSTFSAAGSRDRQRHLLSAWEPEELSHQ